MPRENIGIRLPSELIAELEAQAAATGQTKTELLEQALRILLGIPTESSPAKRISDLEGRVAALEATSDTREAQSSPTDTGRLRSEATVKFGRPTDTGLPLIEAVLVAGLDDITWPRHRRLTISQIKSPRLGQLLRSRGHASASDWLASVGWRKDAAGLWYPPR